MRKRSSREGKAGCDCDGREVRGMRDEDLGGLEREKEGERIKGRRRKGEGKKGKGRREESFLSKADEQKKRAVF